MKRTVISAVAVALCLAAPAGAEVAAYRALRDARPDGRRVAVSGLTLERDAHRLTFKSGTIHLLAPVEGETIGAVFIGEGSYQLTPSTENERAHLALVLRDRTAEVLTDNFDSLVMLFTDGSAKEIEKHAVATSGPPDTRATTLYVDYLEQQKSRFQLNLHLRVLGDLLNGERKGGAFFAAIDGKKLQPALIIFDPFGIGNVGAGFGFFGGEESAFYSIDESNGGFWYLSARKKEALNGRGKPLVQLADAIHYEIDTTIASSLAITGTTKVRIRPAMAGLRVLPVHVLPDLRIKEATVSVGGKSEPVEIIQEEIALGRMKRLFKDEVSDSNAGLVFATALPARGDTEITIRYEGREVLKKAGPESFSIRARESWYPNVGIFTDLATYSLTYRYPKKMTLVSSGKLVSETVEEDSKVAKWQSDQPIRVVGFNYGKFEKLTRNDEPSGVQLEVFTNRTERKMAQDTMADAQNSVRVATAYFGKAPYAQVAVTQQVEWFFGQSWPSLVFLPGVALQSSTDLVNEFGPGALFGVNEFAKTVGWHEIAHQWWGHLVGWESYRDQWLSEGFSEFTSALVLEFTENFKKYDDFWERKREGIFEKSGTISNNDAGPISQGFRLSTQAAPRASQAVIYDKGAYVVHMLRMMLRDPSKANPDEAFRALMRDFVTSYAEKNPSTADFQKVVERHMTPMMNAKGDGKMDYFFKQWVHGTDVPKFKSDLKIDPIDGSKYRLSGTVSQEGVPDDFITLVPIYVEMGRGELAKIGFLRLIGTAPQPFSGEIPLPQKPRRLVVNALHDVLSR